MAYTKKTWVSGETPLSAENMNHIEQGVADAHNDISSLNTKLFYKLPTDTDFNTIVNNGFYTVYSGTNVPTSTKNYYNIIVQRFNDDANYLTQIVTCSNSATIYIRRRNNGNFGGWYKLTPTAV